MLKKKYLSGKLDGKQHVSSEIDIGYDKHYLSVSILDNNKQPVFVEGRLTIEASEDGVVYGSIYNGVVDLSDPYYPRPSIRGSIKHLRVSMDAAASASSDHYFSISIRSVV